MTSEKDPAEKDPADWIDDGARRLPHRPFLRTPEGRELSYAGLAALIARFASALTASNNVLTFGESAFETKSAEN